MNNRSRVRHTRNRCAIFGCDAPGVMGSKTLLCPTHRHEIVRELTEHGLTGCAWPACKEYALTPTRHCGRHIALIAFHGLRVPQVALTYDLMCEDAAKKATAEPEAPAAPKMGTVYYLRSGGYFKIGWTSNLERRMKGYPPDTILLATHPGTKKDENAIHKRFSHLLSHGREWFPLATEIQDHIDRVIAEHGTPPVVDFTARRNKRIVGPRLNQYVGGPNRGKLAAREVRG